MYGLEFIGNLGVFIEGYLVKKIGFLCTSVNILAQIARLATCQNMDSF